MPIEVAGGADGKHVAGGGNVAGEFSVASTSLAAKRLAAALFAA